MTDGVKTRRDGSYHYISAAAALTAINDDWDMWCDPATIAMIGNGTFDRTRGDLDIGPDEPPVTPAR